MGKSTYEICKKCFSDDDVERAENYAETLKEISYILNNFKDKVK
jgi:hypothetical protein